MLTTDLGPSSGNMPRRSQPLPNGNSPRRVPQQPLHPVPDRNAECLGSDDLAISKLIKVMHGVPKFVGSSGQWSLFIGAFEKRITHMSLSDNIKMLLLQAFFSGSAFEYLGTISETIVSYDQLKLIMSRRFSERQTFEGWFTQWRELKQGSDEDLLSFTDRIRRLTELAFEQAGASYKDTLHVSALNNGLYNRSIAHELHRTKFKNLEEDI